MDLYIVKTDKIPVVGKMYFIAYWYEFYLS